MEQDLNQQLLDKLTKVCICKGISRSRIKEAIENGAGSVEDIKRITGAGSGSCGGRRCTPKLLEILEKADYYS